MVDSKPAYTVRLSIVYIVLVYVKSQVAENATIAVF